MAFSVDDLYKIHAKQKKNLFFLKHQINSSIIRARERERRNTQKIKKELTQGHHQQCQAFFHPH